MISGLFLFRKGSSGKEQPAPKPEEAVLSEGNRKDNSSSSVVAAVGASAAGNNSNASAALGAKSEAQSQTRRSYEENLRAEGYKDNPDDPYTLIKKIKNREGQDRILIAAKNPQDRKSFDMPDRDAKTADEVLASKKFTDPASEISSLKRLDENDQNSMMFFGRFRDDGKDIEIYFSPLTDEKGEPKNEDVICFVAPKLGYDFKRLLTGQVRTDDTGYALLRISENLYVRTAWASEGQMRVLHSQIITIDANGASHVQENFNATEAGQKNSSLKYCD
jgi:hypothetical protein